MTSRNRAHEITRKIIQCSKVFAFRHKDHPRIQPTFGYFTHHPVARLNQKRLIQILKDSQALAQGSASFRILDLACGGGLISCALAEQGYRTLGLDLSTEEIQLAQLFAQECKLNGVFAVADLMAEPATKTRWEQTAEDALGGKPQVIVLAYALHHLPEVEKFVERLSQWMLPGTHLLINEENPRSPLFRLKHRVRTWLQNDTETEWHRSYEEWKELLERHGFRTAPAAGIDPIPGWNQIQPQRCWSLVFTAQKI